MTHSLSPLNIPALLRANGLSPRKSLGQNFLVDLYALERVAEAAEMSADSEVLEIGPGLGSLTRLLAARARRVAAVELDQDLIPVLRTVLADYPNVILTQGDILNLDPASLIETDRYSVVANIPYYITSAVIRHLLEAGKKPERVVLTIQKEVAERVCALPGDMSLLALSVQVYGRPRLEAHIPAGSFYPPPKVDSSILRVDIYSHPRIPAESISAFFRLAKAGFSQKRKTLRNSLSGGLGWVPARAAALLQASNIDPQRRAETLSIEEWGLLTANFTTLSA